MIIGQTLVGSFEWGDVSYSPWFSRRGNAGTFGCEMIGVAANSKLDIVVQHKNTDAVDSAAASAATFASITTTGTTTVRATNLKELVRFQYTTIPLAGNTAWLHFRMLPPAWETS